MIILISVLICFKKNAILLAYREGNIEAGGVSMDGILDGKPGMTIDELIALLEKGPIKQKKKKTSNSHQSKDWWYFYTQF